MATTAEPSDRMDRVAPTRPRRPLLALLAVTALALWLLPLTSSLSFDEAQTWWVISSGWRETAERAMEVRGESPVYYLIVWLATWALGRSELVLRLPSVLALLAGAFFLARLARELLDGDAELPAAISFVSVGGVAFVAADATATAVALGSLIGATFAFVRWLRTGRTLHVMWYALLAAVAVHIEPAFAVALLVHLVYAIRWTGPERPVSLARLLAAGALLAILVAPLLVHVLLVSEIPTPSASGSAAIGDLVAFLVPVVPAASLLVGLFLSSFIPGFAVRPLAGTDGALRLVVAWVTVPPLALFLLEALTSRQMLVGRYVLCASPGIALAAAWALRSITPVRARVVATAAFAAIALLAYARASHGQEDWRSAAKALDGLTPQAGTPILVHSGSPESASARWLEDPEVIPYLNAPFYYYPVTTTVPLPARVDSVGRPYLDVLVEKILLRAERFYLVSRFPPSRIGPWLEGRLERDGFRYRTIARFGTVEIGLFERS